MKDKKKINWRSFTSLYIAISFIIMVISGIILFLAPPGRIAHWSYWTIFGLTKTEWQNIHTIFTFLFIVAGGFHIYYNWKPLMHYLKNKKQEATKIKSELLLALFSSLLIFIVTLANIPPFGTVIDFGEYLTESWEDENNSPPIPHAEKLTLAEFSRTINIPISQIGKNLNSAKIDYSEVLTLEEIAKQNNITPNKIYAIINESGTYKVPIVKTGSGYGKKTIEQICNDLNIDVQEGLRILSMNNISANKNDKLKNLAVINDLLPIDIYKLLSN